MKICPKCKLEKPRSDYFKSKSHANGLVSRCKKCTMEDKLIYTRANKYKVRKWTIDVWHLDHIVPVSAFDFSKESSIYAAYHYSNLQPLWAVDNLKKGSRRV
jgi:hypothetical protein